MSKFKVGDRVEGTHGKGVVTSIEGGWSHVTFDNYVEKDTSSGAFRGSDVQVADLYSSPEVMQTDFNLTLIKGD